MKSIIILSALLFSTSVFASPKKNQYKLEIELSIDGKKVSSPMLHVLEGRRGTIESVSKTETRYIDVVVTEATMNGKKGIQMKFDVGVIQSDGTPQVEFKPMVLSKNGEEAEITNYDDSGNEKVKLKVVAHRLVQ